MKILVYEHVTGGGFAGADLPSSILSEGYAMLRALISDLKAAGCEVVTLIDSRIGRLNPPLMADVAVPIQTRSHLDENLKRASKTVDGVYIIAPESDGILKSLVEIIEASGGNSLNCEVEGIEKASNKMEVHKTLDRLGLQSPETVQIDVHEDVKEVRRVACELGFPLVFKPIDGVGSSGLSVLKDEAQIVMAVEKIRRESQNRYFIVQRLVEGVAASVSLISTGKEALPITLNGQMVTLAPPSLNSRYDGGFVPLDHELRNDAFRAARLIVKSLGGLRGYVGVDLVLAERGPVVVEVNPRLTTSYVGLRRIVNFNPAQAVVDALLERRLPRDLHTSGYAFFRKVKVPKPAPRILSRIYRLNGVLSPPFPVGESKDSYALLVSHSADVKRAEEGLQKSKRDLLSILQTGGYAW